MIHCFGTIDWSRWAPSSGLLALAAFAFWLVGPPWGASSEHVGCGRRAVDLASVAYSVDLATAAVDELCLLPGVGRTLAARIIRYRVDIGLRVVQDVEGVQGIGPFVCQRVAQHARLGRLHDRSRFTR